MRLEWFTCRVQFVNDTDPLAYSNTSFPEPTRPPFHCFNANIPLVNQLPAVHRLLGAPHQVVDYISFEFYLKDSVVRDEGTMKATYFTAGRLAPSSSSLFDSGLDAKPTANTRGESRSRRGGAKKKLIVSAACRVGRLFGRSLQELRNRVDEEEPSLDLVQCVSVCIKQSRACTGAARHSSGSSVPRSTNRRNERLGSNGCWLVTRVARRAGRVAKLATAF